ncbi:MAG TPA: FtsX-like permease family protein, partial [Mucilaginibacter sp.]
DAINKRLDFWGKTYTIVGVVDNYHQQSLRDTYDAIIFRCIPDLRGDISVKIGTSDVQQTVEGLRANWKAFFPGDQFDYFFLDQHFNEQYHADKQFGQVFATFTGIGIFVACLGLFGLVSYTIVQRTKEIGIRKVLGASVNGILQLLYKDFAMLVIIAFIVAAPLAWYASYRWLQTYAFRIDVNWTLFVIPFVEVLFIAFATVSYLTIKAALMNPVKSLKTE